MPSIKKHRANKKLLHSRPTNEAEYSDNLNHLAKHEQIHRLQQQHHLRVAQMHVDQAKVMQRLSTTNPVAGVHQTNENNLAERHKQAAGLHSREIERVKILRQHQRNGLHKLRGKRHKPNKIQRGSKRHRRHRVRSKDEGKLGNISREQLGTRFGTNEVMDYSRGWLRLTPQNLTDSPPNLPPEQIQRMTKRMKGLAKKIFRIGTMTNLSPYNGADDKVFGIPRSTM